MRPLEGHAAGEIELLQEVLKERADCINAAVAGVQPQRRFSVGVVLVGLEAPVLDDAGELFREVLGRLIALLDATGLLSELKGIGLCLLTGQREDEAEVGVVIGHVSFRLIVEG